MPVIMMSGHATIDTAVEATKIGAQSFLKAHHLQKLLKAVEAGLARNGIRKAGPVQWASWPANCVEAAMMTGATTCPRGGNGPPAAPAVRAWTNPARRARRSSRSATLNSPGQEGGSMTRVAEKTGLERTHLYRKLKQLGVDLSRANRAPADV